MKAFDKVVHSIFGWEDRTKRWIETHRVKWYLFIFTLGITIGQAANFLFHGPARQGIIMSSVISFMLMATEFSAGGQGISE